MLYVAAGGRCEFDGCNRDLMEHHVTHGRGNYGEMAHICAFSSGGPRARRSGQRPVHDLSNLMLLCGSCHKAIDDNPAEFPILLLQKHKQAHEGRLSLLAGVAPDRQTTAIVVTGKVDGQTVGVLREHMQEAVAPDFINPHDVVNIDLTSIEDRPTESFWETATREIQERIRERFGRKMPSVVERVSVFALAPIPLLMFLGSRLSNKIPVALYQRHRDTEKWAWKSSGQLADFMVRRLQEGTNPSCAALVLSLSGTIHRDRLPSEIDERFSIDEITLVGQEPGFLFLNQAEDLWRFRKVYFAYLEKVTRNHPDLVDLLVFPAVPAPIAVACGLDLMAKPHFRLVVYDLARGRTGFRRALEVQRDDRE